MAAGGQPPGPERRYRPANIMDWMSVGQDEGCSTMGGDGGGPQGWQGRRGAGGAGRQKVVLGGGAARAGRYIKIGGAPCPSENSATNNGYNNYNIL